MEVIVHQRLDRGPLEDRVVKIITQHTKRTPGLKTLGFLFAERFMETDTQNDKATWLEQFELNDDQLERLIENKFIRASEYRKALLERESRAHELG